MYYQLTVQYKEWNKLSIKKDNLSYINLQQSIQEDKLIYKLWARYVTQNFGIWFTWWETLKYCQILYVYKVTVRLQSINITNQHIV